VTSVHQTTAGKMIFGRFDDRGEAASRQTAAPSAVEAAAIRPVPEARAPEQAPPAAPPAAVERPPR